jgi:hypothetical protein
MSQEQWRTRCGMGGGRSALAMLVHSAPLVTGATKRSGAGTAVNESGNVTFDSSDAAVRSAGRTLQLQVRDCICEQPSMVFACDSACGAQHERTAGAFDSATQLEQTGEPDEQFAQRP